MATPKMTREQFIAKYALGPGGTFLADDKGGNAATLNINYSPLPTEAALASLNSGSVYRDTTDNHALKVKP